MTVISEPISNIAGADNGTSFMFVSPVIRESDDGTGLITTHPTVVTAVNGVLTTPDLDPGPATVRIGARGYSITIPDSPTPIRLWPLIEAGLPVPPAEEAAAVKNGGGIARAQRVTQSWFAANSHDPDTLYLVIAD
ncbi:hypothetical protein GV794_01840 [Nocardia cyriacigeorgica]|uniref:Uncharacterized protein n=1 Tax=Nocardia cyriacigeorgica TaxID=135487 RepID=A0ABX0CCX1_9NOCA|nr:hypothetical protein [Nocardia cyriacigeorgica]NEW40766.1 hypothetical protein [Nocardia cyriacigeorgica]NEW51007.1 hypothetical protein [Nocardia cyriacigeorgica]NEW54409.1 hypothetical protein [Nocardia cyriacigeorgica]